MRLLRFLNHSRLDRRSALTLLAAPLLGQQHGAHEHGEDSAVPFERNTSDNVPVRRDISRMKADDEQLLMFRAAVQEMKRRSEKNKLDPLGWYQNASLHALFCATNDFNLQIHYCWLFLPWHRAYLAFLERKMRAVIHEPRLALPYWDWHHSPGIPAHFFGSADNPLADSTRIQGPSDRMPADFIDVSRMLRAPRFEIFGGFAKRGPDDEQIEGLLEQAAHNNTHNWIGGNMAGFPSAGFDPMFAAHHGNVDRLWEAWLAASPNHTNPDSAAWLDYPFYFHDEKGRMVRIRIRDLVRPEWLGYRFDTLAFPAPAESQTSYALVRFERSQVPVHPYCSRFFLATPGHAISFEPGAPEFCGTSTLLPVGDHKSGFLDRWVSMIVPVNSRQAAAIVNSQPMDAWLMPVSLRGRQMPTTPLKLQSVQWRLL